MIVVARRTPLVGAIRLDFTPPRLWKVHIGNYIYLRVLGIYPLSFAESYPFNII